MAAIDEVLEKAQLSADERKLLDNVLQKNPELKAGWERLGDYTKKTQELATRKREYDDAVEFNSRMKVWADEKVPVWEGLVAAGAIDAESKPLWPAEKEAMKRELEEAKRQALAGGIEMDAAELDRRVEAIVKLSGGVTKAELSGLVQMEAKKLAEETVDSRLGDAEKRFNEKTIPYVAGFSAQMAIEAVNYKEVTGERFTKEKQKEFYDFMSKQDDFEPESAMAKFLKPTLDKKSSDAEVERRVQERVAEMRKNGDMPGAGNGEPYIPIEERRKGSLSKMLEDSAAAEGDLESLIMAAGAKAAAELRSEGKS